jgi:F-type H+-transporting ATPase subunit gamma
MFRLGSKASAVRPALSHGTTLASLGVSKHIKPNVQARTFATEKQLKTRMKAVNNIKKITRAMKMVAAAKLRRSQEALEVARDFSKSITALWPDPEKKTGESKTEEKKTGNRAIIGITSDRGLCGAVNAVVIRDIKGRLNNLSEADKANPPTVCLYGEKARIALERQFSQYFGFAVAEQSKLKRYTFRQALAMASVLNEQKFDDSLLIYNYFKSLLAYETRAIPWFSLETGLSNPNTFIEYEIEGDNDFWENLYEFRSAVRLYHFFAETETAELSSRMNAMGGSAKNAGEMLDRLRLMYNRTRQARITTELIEIISGAVALE